MIEPVPPSRPRVPVPGTGAVNPVTGDNIDRAPSSTWAEPNGPTNTPGPMFGTQYVDNISRGPERTGYTQQPVLDANGKVLGYNYIRLQSAPTPTRPTGSGVGVRPGQSYGDEHRQPIRPTVPTRQPAPVMPPDPNGTLPQATGVVSDPALVQANKLEAARQTQLAAQAEVDKLEADRKNNISAQTIGAMWSQWGVDGTQVTNDIWQWISEGRNAESISILIREKDYYKKVFGYAREQERALGLSARTEREIVDSRTSYKQAITAGGLDPSKYDSKYFDDFYYKSVSALEVKDRVEKAVGVARSQDPYVVQGFAELGIGVDGIAEYFLDKNKTQKEFQKIYDTGVVLGQSDRYGIGEDVTSQDATRLVDTLTQDNGRSLSEVGGAFNRVATQKQTVDTLAKISGENVTTGELINTELSIDPVASAKVQGLKSQERARFGGSSSGTKSLGKDISGKY